MLHGLFSQAQSVLRREEEKPPVALAELLKAPLFETKWDVVLRALSCGVPAGSLCDPATGETFLMRAARENRADVIEKLVCRFFADPNLRDKDGNSATSYAALRGNGEALSALARVGASLLLSNKRGEMPLMLSALAAASAKEGTPEGEKLWQSFETLLELLAEDETQLELALLTPDLRGRSVLLRVINDSPSSRRVALKLLEVNCDADGMDEGKLTPLEAAIAWDDPVLVKALAFTGRTSAFEKRLPFQIALNYGSKEALCVLVNKRMSLDPTSVDGQKILSALIASSRDEEASILVNRKGDTWREYTILFNSIKNCDWPLFCFLLKEGADPNRKNSRQQGALQAIIELIPEKLTEDLGLSLCQKGVEAGGSVLLRGLGGRTARSMAEEQNLPLLAAWLAACEKEQAHKAPSVSARKALGLELYDAVETRRNGGKFSRETVLSLLEGGADPNAIRFLDEPFLLLCVRCQLPLDLFEKIVSIDGVNLEIVDPENRSALCLALMRADEGGLAYAKILLEHGALINRNEKTQAWPLYSATLPSNNDCVWSAIQFLADYGVNLNEGDACGQPIVFLISPDTIPPLLEAGADPTIRNRQDVSLTDCAKQNARAKPVRAIIEKAVRDWEEKAPTRGAGMGRKSLSGVVLP